MWSNALRILTVAVATPFVFAAPAAADPASYLQTLMPTYTNVTGEQLLSAGMNACSAMRGGMNGPQAVQMVQDDIGVSVTAAGDIVAAAVVHLDC